MDSNSGPTGGICCHFGTGLCRGSRVICIAWLSVSHEDIAGSKSLSPSELLSLSNRAYESRNVDLGCCYTDTKDAPDNKTEFTDNLAEPASRLRPQMAMCSLCMDLAHSPNNSPALNCLPSASCFAALRTNSARVRRNASKSASNFLFFSASSRPS